MTQLDEAKFEGKVPKGQWFRALVTSAIANDGAKMPAFSQGTYVWARRDRDGWLVVNRDRGTRLLLTTTAAKRHLETLYVPQPLEGRLESAVGSPTGDDKIVIKESLAVSEDDLTEETILVKPEKAGWFQARLLSHIIRDGHKLADFHKRLIVAVRKEGSSWHVVNPKGDGVRLTQRAYSRYVDPIFVPKVADSMEAHSLDGVIGTARKQPLTRVEHKESFARELRKYLRECHA